MIIALTIVIGLCVGSFLNVCIYRLPKEKSIVRPRSFCPSCKRQLAWYDNIPILSFLLLGGKCRSCKAKISFRYIIVEMLTASIFVLLTSSFGLSALTIVYTVFAALLIVATFIDFELQIIPDEITYGGMILGLILSFAFPDLHKAISRPQALLSSFIGLIVGGAIIYAIAWIGTIIFKKKLERIGEEQAMGGGDVKFLAMIGAFIGFKGVLLAFIIASLFGSIIGIIEKIRAKADIIPFGPYLALGAVIAVVWGERIFSFLHKFYFPYG
ncbi:MAG: prepilin peptidase [Candidatus Omnitrophica bacterium]|nr:prepilin peptidase [Candidatus Omnitrophota bacterium]